MKRSEQKVESMKKFYYHLVNCRQIQRQVYCRQAPENQNIEEDSVADNLLQETENLRRSSLSMSKVDTKRKSTTMRRAFLKQTVLDSSCVKVNGRINGKITKQTRRSSFRLQLYDSEKNALIMLLKMSTL